MIKILALHIVEHIQKHKYQIVVVFVSKHIYQICLYLPALHPKTQKSKQQISFYSRAKNVQHLEPCQKNARNVCGFGFVSDL
jgi:hypothetical protein